METLTTPGIYFEPLQPSRVTGDLLRSDIAAFVGYTQKGPINLPVRIDSWRKFLAVFGEPNSLGHLAFSVKAFFENGGVTCYVLRLTDSNAREASLDLVANSGAHIWRAYASFQPANITTNEESEAGRPDSAVLQNISIDALKKPVANPGSWGNNLNISLNRSSRLSTNVIELLEEGFTIRVNSMVGLEEHSIVEISQELLDIDNHLKRIVKRVSIASLDFAKQTIVLKESLLQGADAFDVDSSNPIVVDTIEFDIKVEFEGKIVEVHQWLSLSPEHSKSIHKSLSINSQYIDFTFTEDTAIDWNNTDFWPQLIERQPLQNGIDGISEITSKEYIKALKLIAGVTEVSMVAAPDLVLRTQNLNESLPEVIQKKLQCASLEAPKSGSISGMVNDGTNPIANVIVTDAETGQSIKTDKLGQFTLVNLDISLRTLRFEKEGFEPAEQQAFSELVKSTNPSIFSLVPLTKARQLTLDEILEVQQAMLNPVYLGSYKTALLDAPGPEMKLEEIRSWRSQLGDSAIGSLYYPWLNCPFPTQVEKSVFNTPPSGHIAGILAQMDNLEGPHRSGANIKLRYAKGTTRTIDEIQHGIFNPESINVIRSLSGRGIRVLGTRSLSSNPAWRYFNIRRLVFALEKTLEESLQWAVFESNTVILRKAVELSIRTLLTRLWKSGALAGNSAEAAFRVKCDFDNNSQSQRDNGKLLAEINIAPSIPFEFIRIRFGKTLDAIEVTE